jgi:glycosyl transferase family 2
MTDLSILIPARNEMFLKRTIDDILLHVEGDTEVIAVLDGAWADPPIADHPRVHLVYKSRPIGQRAAVNEAAKLSSARYIMKADAHCAFDQGFDIKLMETIEHDWTVIPRMYNLHVYDWVCRGCGHRMYQGALPEKCEKCESQSYEMDIVWQPRLNRRSDFARFDRDLHFQYWRDYEKRPESKGDIADVMCFVGACFFMERSRYWELGGLDEAHGSWGQMGVEISCKSWLSGGRQVVNKRTWFAHLFRTQPGFGFPYPITNAEQESAREYSRTLWTGNAWNGAVRPLSWLIDKFSPPDWDPPRKGIVYYTDNRLDPTLERAVQTQLTRAAGSLDLVSVSLQPIRFHRNVCLDLARGILTMFKQLLAGLEASTADIIFLCEHDVLYHPSHFDFVPPRRDTFYYNQNVWKVDHDSGQALYYDVNQTSGLCAYRALLLEHYRRRVDRVERTGYDRRIGFEPGTHHRDQRIDDCPSDTWRSAVPNIDIRHHNNLTPSRWRKDQFRDQRYTRGWTESDSVPGWGTTLGRFDQFLEDL